MALVRGIDVAQYQGAVDWKKVAEGGYSFVFVKCTEGTWYRSPTYGAQWQGARSAGIRRGAYHFARWAETRPIAEADFFVSKMGELLPDDLDPALDVEAYRMDGKYVWQEPTKTVNWVLSFADRVKELTGRNIILYTGPSYWAKYLLPGKNSELLTSFRLWVARYTKTIDIAPMRGAPKWDWVVWQNGVSPKGGVPGVNARCDTNFLFSTEVADLDVLVTCKK